jgi:hypothetical protein
MFMPEMHCAFQDKPDQIVRPASAQAFPDNVSAYTSSGDFRKPNLQ